MPRLSEINIYPLKSARGISLQSARLDDRGLEFDRRWMVVDMDGRFVSQRTRPRMALIQVALHADHLAVGAPDMTPLTIPLAPPPPRPRRVQIFDDCIDADDAGDDAASWFREFLGDQCRLVCMPEDGERSVNPKYAPAGSRVSFADAFPVLLISTASLRDLNERLASPVPMNRFRPNLVVEGTGPFDEDTWRHVTIGQAEFLVAKPCARCTVPDVDQDSGVAGKEPIRTLSTYRTRDSKVYFGQNLVQVNRGVLNVGDAVMPALR